MGQAVRRRTACPLFACVLGDVDDRDSAEIDYGRTCVMSTLKPVSAEKLTVKVLMRSPLSPETKAPPTGVTTGTAAAVKIPAAMSILYVPALVLVTVTPCEANCGTPLGATTAPTLMPAPVAPVGPCGPVAPVSPVGPCGPVAPVSPVGPVRPIGPCGPVAPVGPVRPIGPVAPVSPIGPCGPAGPVAPVGPVRPIGPGGPTAPSPPCGPCGPAGPLAPVGPAGPGGPAVPGVGAQ